MVSPVGPHRALGVPLVMISCSFEMKGASEGAADDEAEGRGSRPADASAAVVSVWSAPASRWWRSCWPSTAPSRHC